MKELSFERKIISENRLKAALINNPEIEKLDLSESSVTSFAFLQDLQLEKLNELAISSTRIEDFKALNSITVPNLNILHINNVLLKDLLFVEELPNLEELNCEYSNISSLAPVRCLTKLRRLSITGNKQIVDLSPLSNLKNLTELFLQETGINSQRQLEPIRHMQFKKILANELISSQVEVLLKSNDVSQETRSYRFF